MAHSRAVLWRWLLLGVVLAGCSPRPTPGFLRVSVRWHPEANARCFVVRATSGDVEKNTMPMVRTAETERFLVGITTKDMVDDVTLQAIGFSDDKCITVNGEVSDPQTVPFVTKLADADVELFVLLAPVIGEDRDGDGVSTPDDCDDGNPSIAPGRTELCSDTFDNDCDGDLDCEDSECDGKSCGDGRLCVAGACEGGTCDAPCNAPPGACFGPGVCDVSLDGGCRFPVVLTNTCSDGDDCTVSDRCAADGGCVGDRLDCTSQLTECQSWNGTCGSGSCVVQLRTTGACAAGLCDAQGQCVAGTPWPYPLSNINHTLATGDAGVVLDCVEVRVVTTATPFITHMGCATTPVGLEPRVVTLPAQTGEAVLLSVDSLFIDAGTRLVLDGTRPVIITVRGDATIAGRIVAVAGVDMAGHCQPWPDGGVDAWDGQPGGSGAGYGSAGAPGGEGSVDAGFVPMASPASGFITLSPLRGGCSGQRGAGAGGGHAGRGGGGLQLSVGGTLTVSGLIGAPGAGGGGADAGAFGGGGAGSGGALLLEATTLTLLDGARVMALGGGGGEGSGGAVGFDGLRGSFLADVAADGGADNSGRGGNGGSGASTLVAATAGGVGGSNGSNQGGGGGGGAGVGRVRFNVTTACTRGAGVVVAPMPSTADGGCL